MCTAVLSLTLGCQVDDWLHSIERITDVGSLYRRVVLMIDSYRKQLCEECKLSFGQLLHGLPFITLKIFFF